jgi:hypothetical protein
MKRARFTEDQIIGVLKEHEAGAKTADLARKHLRLRGDALQLEPSGINLIYRLYREEGLTVRKRRARRRAVGSRSPILVESKPNARWVSIGAETDPRIGVQEGPLGL